MKRKILLAITIFIIVAISIFTYLYSNATRTYQIIVVYTAKDFNKSMQTVYLLIGKDSVKGMYMYKDNNETGYSISETNSQELRKILIITNE